MAERLAVQAPDAGRLDPRGKRGDAPNAGYGQVRGQLGVQGLAVLFTFVVVFVISIVTFFAIKKTSGLRVPAAEEDAGLDISSHGMYGYPDAFIPQPEYSTGLPELTARPAAPAAASTRLAPEAG